MDFKSAAEGHSKSQLFLGRWCVWVSGQMPRLKVGEKELSRSTVVGLIGKGRREGGVSAAQYILYSRILTCVIQF